MATMADIVPTMAPISSAVFDDFENRRGMGSGLELELELELGF